MQFLTCANDTMGYNDVIFFFLYQPLTIAISVYCLCKSGAEHRGDAKRCNEVLHIMKAVWEWRFKLWSYVLLHTQTHMNINIKIKIDIQNNALILTISNQWKQKHGFIETK